MSDYVASIESNNKIEIIIDTSTPIELHDFTGTLNAIGETFYKIASDYNTEEKFKPSIHLSEVRKGSYILDLVCAAVPTIPMLLQSGICSATFEVIKATIINLIEGKQPEDEADKKLYKKAADIISPIAKDNGSQIFIKNYTGNKVTNNYYVDSSSAKQGMYHANEIFTKDYSSSFYGQKPMVWVQTNFDSNTQGNKAIIPSINPKPLKVIFDDDEVKNAMTSAHPSFDEPWQDLIYVVDVVVDEIDGIPKYYRIRQNYPELTESKKI